MAGVSSFGANSSVGGGGRGCLPSQGPGQLSVRGGGGEGVV